MQLPTLLLSITAPLALALPTLQPRVEFCTKDLNADFTAAEMQARFDAFADAFIVRKDIDEAFSYIAPEYINHNPFAQDGAQNAYNILAPIWGSQQITVLGTTYHHDELMGWLHYRSGFGDVVDRYRWAGGCIVEHVSILTWFFSCWWIGLGLNRWDYKTR